MNRRTFLAVAGSGLAITRISQRACGASAASVKPTIEGDIAWYDARQWGVEGKGWADTERYFDRLPARAKASVRDAVWNLSRHSAGMVLPFASNARTIHARYTLLSDRLAMDHMPATGVSGLDLYAHDQQKRWAWLGVARPKSKNVNVKLADGLIAGSRAYRVYLPLYNGVDSLEIGVPVKATFTPMPPRTSKPLLFYGTSITHGACASRPGMPHPAILGRRLDRPVINLGFSGNGEMEREVGALIMEIDAAVYVIDCLPNLTGDQVAERAEPLVRQLREARAQTPIVLVEDRTYANAQFKPSSQERHRASRAALRKAYDRLIADGFKHLHYIPGEGQLGDDTEGTTDSSHPNDLGFMRMADALEPTLRRTIKQA
jgi:lysophospholipase L1-like esterase